MDLKTVDDKAGSWGPPPDALNQGSNGDVNMENNEAKMEAAGDAGQTKVSGVHPRLLLNQLQGHKVEFELTSETGPPNPEYEMKCEINGVVFKAVGRSKKIAATSAAEKALLGVHNTRYDPEAEVPSKKAVKRKAVLTEEGKDEDGDENMLGKRQDSGPQGGSGKKKRLDKGPSKPKNALDHLNALKPGTKFTFVSQVGPPHSQVFVLSCEVNGQTFEGSGSSKKLAKLQAAENALKSFVQFPDASEAHQGYIQGTNKENTKIQLTSVKDGGDGVKVSGHPPRMLLNQLQGTTVEFHLTSETGEGNRKQYEMKCELNGEVFEAIGRSKKVAATNAAKKALLKLHNIRYEPGESKVSGIHPTFLLNQLQGHRIEFELNSESGPGSQKGYEMKCEIDGEVFTAYGHSKKIAIMNTAQKALLALHNVRYDPGHQIEADIKMDIAEEDGTKASGMHPRLLLNELQGHRVEFELSSESGENTSKEYEMKCVINGEEFAAVGRSKKIASSNAAEKALLKLHNVRYVPGVKAKLAGADARFMLRRLQGGKVEFELKSESGPPNQRQFEMKCEINGEEFTGVGNSKKRASMIAAEKALLKIHNTQCYQGLRKREANSDGLPAMNSLKISESKPVVGTKVSDSKPAAKQINQSKPVGTKISDSRPVGTKISDSKPVGKPVTQSKPVGTKISDSKPVGNVSRTPAPVSNVKTPAPAGNVRTPAPAGNASKTRSKR